MNDYKVYESVCVIDPNTPENEIKKIIDLVSETIKEDGSIIGVINEGLVQLAFEIKHNKKGVFIIFYFVTTEYQINELERLYRIKDQVIKFMTIRRETIKEATENYLKDLENIKSK